MKPTLMIMSLVIDQTCSKVELEIEVLYEDGTTRTCRQSARRSVKIDFEALYKEAADASAA